MPYNQCAICTSREKITDLSDGARPSEPLHSNNRTLLGPQAPLKTSVVQCPHYDMAIITCKLSVIIELSPKKYTIHTPTRKEASVLDKWNTVDRTLVSLEWPLQAVLHHYARNDHLIMVKRREWWSVLTASAACCLPICHLHHKSCRPRSSDSGCMFWCDNRCWLWSI